MKPTTSKSDQLRALREASLKPHKPVATPSQWRALPASVAPSVATPRTAPASIAASVAPFLAPEGDCPSCDRRRKALYAAQKKRRTTQKAQP